MNSGKLKLILIIIFLGVNIFFAVKLFALIDSKNNFTQEKITDAVQVISKKGVKIAPEAVSVNKTVPETLRLSFDEESAEKAAKKIMHDEYGSFRIPNGQSFTNDNESFSIFYDYSFEYKNFSYETDVNNIKEALYSDKKADKKEWEKLFNKHIDDLNTTSIKLSVKVINAVESNSKTFIECCEYIDGYEIENARFFAVFSDERVLYAYGTFYFSNILGIYSTDSLDSINILFEVDKTDSEIKKMELIYFPVAENSSSYYFAPAYKFTFEDKTIEIYDATGGIKRQEIK